MRLSICHTHSLNNNAWVREEGLAQVREGTTIGDHLCFFGFYFFHWFSFYLWGSCEVFSFMVFPRKILCVSSLVIIVLHVILLDKIIISYCLNDKNITQHHVKIDLLHMSILCKYFQGNQVKIQDIPKKVSIRQISTLKAKKCIRKGWKPFVSSLVITDVHIILSDKILRSYSLNDKNLTWYQS